MFCNLIFLSPRACCLASRTRRAFWPVYSAPQQRVICCNTVRLSRSSSSCVTKYLFSDSNRSRRAVFCFDEFQAPGMMSSASPSPSTWSEPSFGTCSRPGRRSLIEEGIRYKPDRKRPVWEGNRCTERNTRP